MTELKESKQKELKEILIWLSLTEESRKRTKIITSKGLIRKYGSPSENECEVGKDGKVETLIYESYKTIAPGMSFTADSFYKILMDNVDTIDEESIASGRPSISDIHKNVISLKEIN